MRDEQALHGCSLRPTCWKGAVVEGRLVVLGPVKVLAGCCTQEQMEQLVELQEGPRQRGLRQQAHRHGSRLNTTTGGSHKAHCLSNNWVLEFLSDRE